MKQEQTRKRRPKDSSQDPAVYLAFRLRDEVDVEGQALAEDAARAILGRGATILYDAELPGLGFYVDWPRKLILIRPGLPPEVLLHEGWHFVIKDNIDHGCEYLQPDWCEYDTETAADCFGFVFVWGQLPPGYGGER